MGNKPLLYEVSYIRPLVIFLLVVYHGLCVYTGGWTPPEGVGANSAYWWLGHFISGFRIETIAFVGGYVYAFQCIALEKRLSFPRFAWKKFNRLLIPCWIFGIVYLLLYRYKPGMSLNVCVWKVLNGIGHLWFLPMLFWCFLLGWLADKLTEKTIDKRCFPWLMWGLLLVAGAATLVRMPSLRLGLTRAPYFFFYFFLGYCVWILCAKAPGSRERRRWSREEDSLYRRISTGLAILYVVLFLLRVRLTTPWMMGLSAIRVRTAFLPLLNPLVKGVAMAQTCCGILALYLFVMQWLSRKYKRSETGSYRPPEWVLWCSKVCYGTYVFHAFFMWGLFYYTPLPQWMAASAVGAWLLPWVVSTVTLVCSIATTELFLHSKTGRKLIG